MTPAQKAALLVQAIPPEHVHELLSGRAVPKHAWQRGPWGYTDYEGIHATKGRGGPETISWRDAQGIAQNGSGEGRKAAYDSALDEYWKWVVSCGPRYLSDADKVERIVWRDRVSERLRNTASAIIDAGCERYVEQEPLFGEVGGGLV